MPVPVLEALPCEGAILLRLIRTERGVLALVAAVLGGLMLLSGVYALAKFHRRGHPLLARIAGDIGFGRDGALAEQLNYSLTFLVCLLFLVLAIRVRSWIPAFLSVLFGFVLFDDAWQYHERAGSALAGALAIGDGSADLGEYAAWALAGAGLGLLLALALPRRRAGDAGLLGCVAGIVLLLVFCGIGLDLAHAATGGLVRALVGLAKDVGEMVATILAFGLALGLARSGPRYYETCAAVPRPDARRL